MASAERQHWPTALSNLTRLTKRQQADGPEDGSVRLTHRPCTDLSSAPDDESVSPCHVFSAPHAQSLTYCWRSQALMTALSVNADSLPRVFCIDLILVILSKSEFLVTLYRIE